MPSQALANRQHGAGGAIVAVVRAAVREGELVDFVITSDVE
eukprot:SAG31_NODE_7488_length_1672_cov_2.171320_2_plen_40_part_01